MRIDAIRSYIQEEILNSPATPIELDQDLLLSETLDSLDVTRLVEFLEGEFDVRIPAQDVTVENFATLRKIDGYLATLAN